MRWRFAAATLLFQLAQILAYRVLHLRHFRQLFAWNAARVASIGLNETAVHRQVLAFHQSGFHAAVDDLFEQLLKQLRFLKASVAVLRERGVVRNLLIETQPGEPA